MSSNSCSNDTSISDSSSSGSVLAVVVAAVAILPALLVTIYNHNDKFQQLPSLTLVSTNNSTNSPHLRIAATEGCFETTASLNKRNMGKLGTAIRTEG